MMMIKLSHQHLLGGVTLGFWGGQGGRRRLHSQTRSGNTDKTKLGVFLDCLHTTGLWLGYKLLVPVQSAVYLRAHMEAPITLII